MISSASGLRPPTPNQLRATMPTASKTAAGNARRSFGARMVWGSDYPVVTKAMTHRQALESFRTHCTFVSDEDKAAILGGTLSKLLEKSRTVDKN